MHTCHAARVRSIGADLQQVHDLSQVGSVCLRLGIMTNNQAEYYGLLAGLEACKAVGVKRISVRGDSQLVVKQVKQASIGVLCCRLLSVLYSVHCYASFGDPDINKQITSGARLV